MKRYIIAAVLAVFLTACGGHDHDHAQPVERVTVYEEAPSSRVHDVEELSPRQQRAGLEMVWADLPEENKDMLCYGMTEFGPREGYEAFSEGAGGYVVDYDVFVEFFQDKCNGYGV